MTIGWIRMTSGWLWANVIQWPLVDVIFIGFEILCTLSRMFWETFMFKDLIPMEITWCEHCLCIIMPRVCRCGSLSFTNSHTITLISYMVVFHSIFNIWHGPTLSYLHGKKSKRWRTLSPPPPTKFSGEEYSGRGSRPTRKSRFSVPNQKLSPAHLISKKLLPLHSWRPLIHKSHIECTSPSRSQIQFICSLPLSK